MLQGIRLRDVAGGLAKSLDDRLKNSLDRNQAAADRIQDRQSIRAEREVQREEEENRQVSELLTEFANMIDESQVPAGMTKHDYAAGLFNKGGGTIAGATSFLADLREHKRGGGSVSGLIDYATLQTGGRNQGDYVNQFVRQADTMVRIPDALKGGTGLAGKLFDINLGEGIQEEIDASYGTRTPVEKIQMEQLGFKEGAELLGTGDIKKQRQLVDLQIEQAAADLAETQRKAGIENALSNSGLLSNMNRIQRDGGIPLNDDGTIDLQTAAEQNINLAEKITISIQTATQFAEGATGTLHNPANIASIIAQASTKDTNGDFLITTEDLTKDTKPRSGVVYDLMDKDTNKRVPHLYIAGKYVKLYG